MYDTQEYGLSLEIPTDNFLFKKLFHIDIENMKNYLDKLEVVDNKSLIILFGLFHCIEERDFWINPLNEFCNKHDNPLIVFTGKLTSSNIYNFQSNKFVLERLSIFDHISNINWNERKCNQIRKWYLDTEIKKQHKFYWASSKDWYSRRYLLAGLIKNNLLENNLINYKCLYTDIPSNKLDITFTENLKSIIDFECQSIQHMVPLPAIDNTVEFTATDVNFYLNSYLGIVTDTFFDQGVFFSEKVFNAINYQQLFFYIAGPGSLEYLRRQGYCTFDDIIDTTYDNIQDNGQRLLQARESLIDFLKQPLQTISAAYKKNVDNIKHNKNLLQKQRPNLEFTKILQRVINEH
jgi:hypothetical protein